MNKLLQRKTVRTSSECEIKVKNIKRFFLLLHNLMITSHQHHYTIIHSEAEKLTWFLDAMRCCSAMRWGMSWSIINASFYYKWFFIHSDLNLLHKMWMRKMILSSETISETWKSPRLFIFHSTFSSRSQKYFCLYKALKKYFNIIAEASIFLCAIKPSLKIPSNEINLCWT